MKHCVQGLPVLSAYFCDVETLGAYLTSLLDVNFCSPPDLPTRDPDPYTELLKTTIVAQNNGHRSLKLQIFPAMSDMREVIITRFTTSNFLNVEHRSLKGHKFGCSSRNTLPI